MGTHGPGHDPQLARTGADRALAGDEDVGACVSLTACVVVVTLDGLVGHAMRRQRLGQRFETCLGHRAPVLLRIVLGYGQRLPVPVEELGPLVEPSEIAIGQPPFERGGLLARAL